MAKTVNMALQDQEIDIEFYRSLYPDMATKSPEEILLHWQKHGQSEGRLPSEEKALAKFTAHPDLPEDFDVECYIQLNPDVAKSSKWKFQAIDHFLRFGKIENRLYKEQPAPPLPEPAPQADYPENNKEFDADFYRSMYPDMAQADDEKCLAHYRKFGRKENRYQSIADLIENHKNREHLPDDFNLAAYIHQNEDLYPKLDTGTQYIIHYLNFGILEERASQSKKYSPRFIKEYYDYEVDTEKSVDEILFALRAHLGATLETPIYLSAEELAASHGIFSSKFISIFDHEAYKYANPGHEDLPAKNFAKCLEHFLNSGIDKGAMISYKYHFDAEFYRLQYKKNLPKNLRTNSDVDNFSPQNPTQKNLLFKHWLMIGLPHDYYPNLLVWASEVHEFDIPHRIKTDLIAYTKLNHDLEEQITPGDYFVHMVKHGVTENRPGIIYNSETASFFSQVAAFLMRQGKRNEALQIYNRIIKTCPTFPDACHNLGDDLLRHHFYNDAIKYYEGLVDKKTATQWSYINLSFCHDQLGNDYKAAYALQQGRLAFPEDVNLSIKADKATTHHFNKILQTARRKATHIGIPSARAMVREALSLFDTDQFAPLHENPIKHVTIVGNHDLPQCQTYRIDQKIEHLHAAGYHVKVYKHNEKLNGYHMRIDETDAVIFYRVAAIPPIIDAINAANIRGIPTFYEIDDLLFDENVFPPPLETYAGQISAEQHAAMATDVPLLYHAMSMCRYGIASTKALAEEMKPVVKTGKVFLHHNAFGSLHEKMASLPPVQKPEEPITIFYGSGTKAHKDDFHNIIEPVFIDLHKKYGDRIRFIVVGHITLTDNLKALGDTLKLMEPIWDTEDYWTLLREEADINLAVLSRNRVTDTKSEIKWLEAGMFGIPSVVSRTAAHEDVIAHNKDGILCETKEEFFTELDDLICNPDRRTRIGTAAQQKAIQNYSIEAQGQNIDKILKSLAPPQHKARKQRIAVVNVFYPPQAIGGATRVVYDNVSDILDEYGEQFDIHVFTTKNGDTPYEVSRYVHDGVSVSAVTTEKADDLEQRISDPQMGIAFARFLNDVKPDLIHFHCIQRLTGAVLTEARKAEIPYIITAHDGWWISDAQFLVDEQDEIHLYDYKDDTPRDGQKTSDRQRAFKKDLFAARHIMAVSEPFADIYKSTGLPNVITIENGVSALPEVPRRPSPTGRVRLAHIGGMARHKGFHLVKHALMASPEFENLELLVVNHAAKKGSIERESWGSTPVTLIPKVPQQEIATLFSEVDVLLAPSIWPESYGLVTREALMCGCRVIASDLGAIGKCVDHGMNGLVIPVNDAEALRNAFAEIDAYPDFYLSPPPEKPNLRMAVQQARDLAKLYREILSP